MILTDLDQVALIKLGRRARKPEVRQEVEVSLRDSPKIVLSLWHLVETANTSNNDNKRELAKFIDSMNLSWLLDRFDLQKSEVAEDFFRFANIQYEPPEHVTTRSGVFAAINGRSDNPRFDIPAVRVIEQWEQHPRQLDVMQQAYRSNIDALTGMRALMRDGKVTPELRKRAHRKILEFYMPTSSPTGLELGREIGAAYLDQATVESIPTLAIEYAISEHEWRVRDGSGADRNTAIDKNHLIAALPHVDEIVSDDNFFHSVYPVAQVTGHVRAKLLHVSDFLKRFD
jgi:hypothetical protein